MRLYTEYAINKMHMVNVAQGYLYINRVIYRVKVHIKSV